MPGQLSLAIPPWVDLMSASESWGINRHSARCTSLISMFWHCKRVSGWALKKRRSLLSSGLCAFGKTPLFYVL